ncbi:MAG: HAD family hydrolase [Actinobacteria bacterium]|nr:HAD family hydrolase [Actinomycetota bacterium]
MDATTELVIWDFDGTLADTRGVILATFAGVYDELGLGVCDPGAVASRIGLPLTQVFAELLDEDDPSVIADLVEVYRRIFAELVPGGARTFPGVVELLDRCDARGITSAITTSRGRASLEPMLDAFGIADHFAFLITEEDVDHPKPHPEMVDLVTHETGIGPGRALLIGDTTFDLAMGRSAGTRTCGVTWGNHSATRLATESPDHLVDSIDQLGVVIGVEQ